MKRWRGEGGLEHTVETNRMRCTFCLVQARKKWAVSGNEYNMELEIETVANR